MKIRRKRKVSEVPKMESLKQINLNAAGVDVGASELYVCVRKIGRRNPCAFSKPSPPTCTISPHG
jgi:hypothetical protein